MSVSREAHGGPEKRSPHQQHGGQFFRPGTLPANYVAGEDLPNDIDNESRHHGHHAVLKNS